MSADGNSTLTEPNEANNGRYAVVKIGPDLHVSALTGPSSAARGATIVVTATVRNRGVSPAAASTARFYLSTRKTYDATAIPLGRRAVPTLAAGAQSQAATSLTLTASAGGRTYYVLVIADGDGVIAEPLETNSLSYLTVVIP